MEKGSSIEAKHLQGYLLDVAEQFSIEAPLLGAVYQNLKVYEEMTFNKSAIQLDV